MTICDFLQKDKIVMYPNVDPIWAPAPEELSARPK